MIRKGLLTLFVLLTASLMAWSHPAPRAEPLPEKAPSFLGVEVDAEQMWMGATIRTIQADSPAQRAGLKERDVILELDGRSIDCPNALLERIACCRPGSQVTIRVMRGDVAQTLVVAMGCRRHDMSESEGDRLFCPKCIINAEEPERQTGVVEGVGEEFLQQ